MSGRGAGDRPASLVAMERLRDAAARLAEIEDGGGAAGRWFAERVGVYETAGGRISLDVALGLAPAPGREGWWTTEARLKRNQLLCELAVRFYADEPSARCRARQIASQLRQFASGARRWRPGSREELFNYIVRLGPPPSARTVQRALCQMLPPVAGTPLAVAQCNDQQTAHPATAAD